MCKDKRLKVVRGDKSMYATMAKSKNVSSMSNLEDLRRRAIIRKNDNKLRHLPNKCDINTANENALFLAGEQEKTIL